MLFVAMRRRAKGQGNRRKQGQQNPLHRPSSVHLWTGFSALATLLTITVSSPSMLLGCGLRLLLISAAAQELIFFLLFLSLVDPLGVVTLHLGKFFRRQLRKVADEID